MISLDINRITSAERACAVGLAAASEINDELTIILNAADELDEFVASDEIRQAVQRIIWKTSGLINYAANRGVRPSAQPMSKRILESMVATERRY